MKTFRDFINEASGIKNLIKKYKKGKNNFGIFYSYPSGKDITINLKLSDDVLITFKNEEFIDIVVKEDSSINTEMKKYDYTRVNTRGGYSYRDGSDLKKELNELIGSVSYSGAEFKDGKLISKDIKVSF
jgi:hypothetical protein